MQVYNGKNGSKFGSFFKLKFQNHIIDIIRRENAIKRKANHCPESYDNLASNGKLNDRIVDDSEDAVDISNQFEKIMAKMSCLELIAFQFLLGKITKEDACESAKCDMKQILRAVRRCKNKLKNNNKP
ncbi:hypothetical protein COSHB9_15250 [Companilactobacillus alimentarius]|uniref:Uncharacterized protein n=1 Tax=Companilactobacillus alimentarius DSM 20249 TaxID=1423720 RepID=A0A2K9HRR6_9LACO|nr:hypothetical protein LA20249_11000 [Companilactobacillus alimentarius DSM 20249]GEO45391.1 hypothetical protein LAL01_16230 [Companilactobacillus alimentarius]